MTALMNEQQQGSPRISRIIAVKVTPRAKNELMMVAMVIMLRSSLTDRHRHNSLLSSQ